MAQDDWNPLDIDEDGVFYVSSLVDLSRRNAVILRGGTLWKG